MNLKILFLLLILAAVTACSSGGTSEEVNLDTSNQPGREVAVEGGTYRDISVSELQTMMDNKDFTLVNVHIPFEGDIPETDISFPFDQVEGNLDKLPEDKDAKIVLYCRSDRMSNIAAEELVGLGYTNIWNLDGGFNAWKDAGLPMEGE